MVIVLPNNIFKRFKLKVSSQIKIQIVDKTIYLIPMEDKKLDSLRLLFKGYKGTYQPILEHDNQPKGDEVW